LKHKIFFVITLCIPFIFLEVVFRVLPVCYPPYILTTDEKNPVARFQENTNYLYSNGWNFNIISRKRTNNWGFANDQDYIRSDSSPLMVIIGDSFVEAHQVANEESMHGILAKEAKPFGRVYSLGLSGAQLSQYLIFAEHAKDELSPNSMVFIIIGNDFDESLIKYKSSPRLHYFEEKNDKYVLTLIDYNCSVLKKILRKSAFVRYLMLNLHIKENIKQLLMKFKHNPMQFVGNVPSVVSCQRLENSKKAVDEFFHQLPVKSGLGTKDILFVIDGLRPSLYSEEGLMDSKESYCNQIRTYFIRRARQLGYELVDMQPVFIEKNRHDGSTFEFPYDGHWNQLGHKLVASEIAKSQLYKSTFTPLNTLIKKDEDTRKIKSGSLQAQKTL